MAVFQDKPEINRSKPKPPRRKGWRLLMIFGGILAAFGCLILLAPTIVSSPIAREWLLRRLNQNLSGNLEIDDWSIGWRSGLEVRGVRIHDDQQRLIFECREANTQLGFMDLLRGRYTLGKVILTEPNCDVLEIDRDGETNLGRVWRRTKGNGQGQSGGSEVNEKPPASVSGEFIADRFRATVVAVGWGSEDKVVVIDPSRIRLKVVGKDQPIENEMTLNLRTVSGMHHGVVTIHGTFPAGEPFEQAIENVVADIDVGFDACDFDGLNIGKAAFPLHLEKGILRVAGPAVIDCNQGKIDLTGTSVTLNEPHWRLNIPDQTPLARGVHLNAELADKLCRFVSPIFLHPKEARGTIDLTAVACHRVPLDGLIESDNAENDGRAELAMRIDHANISGGEMEHFLKQIQLQDIAARAEARVPGASLIVENGKIKQDVPFQIGDFPAISFQGTLELRRMYYDPLNMVVSRELLKLVDILGLGLAQRFPNGWTFSFRGPSRSLQAVKGTRLEDMIQAAMSQPKQ